MKIKIIDEVGFSICDITIMIKFGQKRGGWTRVKIVSIPISQNSCPGCVFQKVCHETPLCSKIVTEVVGKGYLMTTSQHYRLCREIKSQI